MDSTETTCSSAEGELVLLRHSSMEHGGNQQNTRRYNVIAVHGLGNVGGRDSAWSWRQDEGTTTAWLTEFFPLHVGGARIMTYSYSIPQKTKGIFTRDIKSLAERLLVEILAKFDTSKEFVFLGHGLGGLIIKEALSIARRNKIYYMVAGKTAVLIFFETPHRSTSERSWEGLANWLLLVSGEDRLFSLGWIQAAAGMMKSACVNFKSSERLYRVINVYYQSISPSHHLGAEGTNWQSLDESSATLGTPQELKQSRDEPHGRICAFSSDTDAVIELLCKEINASSGPGRPLIECLETLASIADFQLHGPSLPSLYNRTSPKTLDVLVNHPIFCQWMAASNGPLQIIVPFGDDSSLLFSKLQTAYTNGEKSSSSAIISYVFSPRSPDKNNETTLLASLCYQLLCLKPQLFEHVATLNDSLQKFAKDVVWRVHRLFILFRSLLSCPHEGETICVLREMDGTKFPERLVPNLLSLATGVDSKFKLVIISGTSTTSKIPAVQLKQEEFDLEAVLDYELDSLISNRPGLLTTRSTLRKGLLTQHEKKPGLFVGMFDAVTAAVRVWLELIIKIAEPVSVSSITHSLALMPNKIEDIYKDILQRIPHHCRRKMRSVLSWLALSQRPLEVAELAAISALEDEIQTIDALRKNTQVNLSGDLQIAFGTVIQINDNRYPLLPGELRAFLLRGHPKDKKSECDGTCVFCLDGELELARTCLRFLRLYKEEDPHSLVAVQKDHPFLRYASRRWPDHYINGKSAMLQGQEQSPMSSNPSPSDVLDFSRDDDKLISFWAKMYYLLQNPDVECPAGTSLPMAAEVGCLDLVKSLLPSMDAEQEEDAAALSRGFVAAISRGDTEIIDAFIAAKVSSSLALHAAASSGQRHLLERLTTFKDALEAKGMEGLTQLHCACRSGVLGVVEDLLDAGADAKAKSSDEETTPLHIACMFGHAAVIRRLEELDDLDINAKDKFGRTPLYYACKWQQPDAVRALLQDPKGREIDVNMVDSKSETTALHHAAGEGRLDILKLILSYRYPSKDAAADKLADGPADDWEDASDDEVDDTSSKDSYTRVQNLLSKKDASDSTALHFAARDGHLEVAKELARRENSLSLAASLKEDSEGNLPIHLASKNGHASIVKLLLKNNISTQLSWMASGEEYALPIHLAVSHGHIEVVRHLAEAHEKERVVSLDLFYGRQRSALHLAATSGQIDIVRLLVEHGATPDILDFDDATPLLLACQGGHEAVADFLVKKGADVSIPNDRKLCPLIAAIQARNVNLARLLLENGAKTNVATSAGTTPLLAAAQAGNVSIMEILNSSKTDWGARDDQGLSALHWAAKSGSDEAIDFVLQHSNLIDVKDNNGRTVLHYAAQDESLSVIRRKLRGNFGLFEGDNSGETPLELAQPEGVLKELLSSTDLHDAKFEELRKKLVRRSVHRGYAETVATLWDKDAKLGEADSSEQTLLHIAAQAGHHHIVNYLVNDAKIRPDAKDAKGRTALSLAAEEGHLEVVKFLAQEAPTGTKETDSEGNTPLVYASGMGHLNVVSFLLDYANPDVNSKDLLVANNKNRGPLWAAVSGNRTEIVKLLLQQGAEVNIVERSESFTPLHLAVQHNFVDIIDLLLAADGIDGHARDDKDRTPIYIGAYYGRTDAVKKLIDAGWLGNFPESTCHWLPLHAAYDNPDILQLLIDKAKMDVNKADRDGSTALHLAAQGYPNSVRLLLQRDANPILPDNERITPLHLAAKCSDPDTVGLILDKALATKTSSEEAVNIPGLKDMMGRSAFLAATASGNTSVVHFFLKRELFDPLETDNDDITAVDLAVKSDSSSTVELLLNVVGSDFKPETQRRVLVWAAGGNSSNSVYRNIETQLIELLQDGEPMGPWEDKKLFELAMEREDIPLAKLLRYHGLGEMAAQRDKHRWTLEQIIGAFEPKSEKDEEEGQDEKPLPPSQWDTNRKADSVKTAKLETYGTVLRMRFESPYSSRLGSVLSDHPVPPTEKFYFEITVISGSEESLCIGFGRQDCTIDRMPGWDDDTWGLHGDDGGIYHADGWRRERSDEWKYGTDDVVGVCVDPRKQTAFYTKNGEVIEIGFANMRGRIFPMVGLGPGAEIVANFGTDLDAVPFKYPDGRDREYNVTRLIE